MKLLGSTKSKLSKNKSGENVLSLKIADVVLINRNIADKDYQQDSRVLYTFVHNKLFRHLLDI